MKKILCFALLIWILFGVTACGKPAPEGIALAVVIGKHANSNSFTDEDYAKVRDLMKRAFVPTEGYDALADISVIVSDGAPKTDVILDRTGKEISLNIDENSAQMRGEMISKRVEEGIMPYLRSDACRAGDAENDLLGAISEAALMLRNKPGIENHLVILDSGVTTAGYFNMLNIDVQTVPNEEIVENLNAHGVIPDLTGIDVTFLGLGNVAMPQEIKDPNLRDKLVDLWTKIIESGHGMLTEPICFSPMGTDAMMYYETGEGYPYVSVVPFSDFEITMDGTVQESAQAVPTEILEPTPVPAEVAQRFSETGNEIASQVLGFKPDSATYRNEETSLKNLKNSAELLKLFFKENPNGKVYVVGSEARGQYGVANTGNLSLERAEKVRQTLARLLENERSVSEQLISIGASDRLPWRIEPEFSPDGTRNEEASERNRAVWLVPETAAEKIRQLKAAGLR